MPAQPQRHRRQSYASSMGRASFFEPAENGYLHYPPVGESWQEKTRRKLRLQWVSHSARGQPVHPTGWKPIPQGKPRRRAGFRSVRACQARSRPNAA
jgi:hypothetical protein